MKHLSSILIILFLAAACNSPQTEQTGTDNNESTEKIASVEIAIINVSGMHCEGCEKTISDALSTLEGVKDARASFLEEQAKVKYDPAKVGIKEFTASIEDIGYSVSAYEIMPMEDKIIEQVE
ncbi:MAG: heavy-metal-associated domain-containing protein [Bacteroidetes bacterium]|nr:heavy-metal-associated domain-containing protein [Bacteroidota bacterium]